MCGSGGSDAVQQRSWFVSLHSLCDDWHDARTYSEYVFNTRRVKYMSEYSAISSVRGATTS